jgi:hypothetical protein
LTLTRGIAETPRMATGTPLLVARLHLDHGRTHSALCRA